MPVSFFVDPAIVDDADARKLSEITLSYTFYPLGEPKVGAAPAAAEPSTGPAAAAGGRS